MIKRYLSLALAFVILGFSLVVPAQAAESDSVLLDVLSYGSIKSVSTGSFIDNYFYFDGTSCKISFDNPSVGDYNYVDMVVSWAYTSTLTSVTFGREFNQAGLTISHITGNMYRVYGQVTTQRIDDIFFTFNCSGSVSYCTIYSLKIGSIGTEYVDTEAFCSITADNYTDTIHFVPTDTINHRFIDSSADINNTDFECFISTLNWRDFDYIDFQFYFDCAAVTSVSAVFGSSVIPVDYSLVQSSSIDGDSYYLTLRLDVSSLDKSSSDYPQIIVTGRFDFQSVNLISFVNCSGHITRTFISPLAHFFSSLRSWIDSLGDRIVSALNGNTSSGDDFKDDSSGLISDLDDISGVLDSVQRPSMDNVNMDFTGNISGATSLMATTFNSFTSIPWVNTIFMASITLALISYILFGKE